jgi:hypothetical protein
MHRGVRTQTLAKVREKLSAMAPNLAKNHLFAPSLCNAPIRRNDDIDPY